MFRPSADRETDVTELLASGTLQGVVVGALGAFFAILLQARGMVPRGPLAIVGAAVIGFLIGRGINRALFRSGEAAARAVYHPDGTTTAYTRTFSHIEAMEVRGDLDGAGEAWEGALAEHPHDLLVHVRVADFHLRLRNDPHEALERFQRARALGAGPVDVRRYVQQKIVDLHLGSLADEGRAMVELRRLIDAFPDSREARAARGALAALKAKRGDAP